MKKLVCSVVLMIATMLSVVALSSSQFEASAAKYGEYLTYSVSGGVATITGCDDDARDITIPSKINGYSVTSIASGAFKGCTVLRSIVIPASISSIGADAFSGCTALKTVNAASLSVWCRISFGNEYANPVYYARKLYVGGRLITGLSIPDGVTGISAYAFIRCSSIQSVIIPTSLTYIGNSAFYGCDSIGSVYCLGSEEAWNALSNKPTYTNIYFNYVECTTHTWNEGTIVAASDCKNEGTRAVTCTVCGVKGNLSVPTIDEHVYGEWRVTRRATCTEDGIRAAVCRICEHQDPEVIKALGHTYDDGTVKKAPTATEEGIMVYTCKTCKAEKEEAIPVVEAETTPDGETVDTEPEETTEEPVTTEEPATSDAPVSTEEPETTEAPAVTTDAAPDTDGEGGNAGVIIGIAIAAVAAVAAAVGVIIKKKN